MTPGAISSLGWRIERLPPLPQIAHQLHDLTGTATGVFNPPRASTVFDPRWAEGGA